MSYCRFEGTRHELGNCIVDLNNCKELSDSEARHAGCLRELCEQYIDAYEEWREEMEDC